MGIRYSIRADMDGKITVMTLPCTNNITPETKEAMEITEAIALQLAKTAFGETAKVRVIPTSTDPATKFRIAYVAPDAVTPTVVGYGSNWNEALQASFISDRGQMRIEAVSDEDSFRYVMDNSDKLIAVQVTDEDGDFYQFDFDAIETPWMTGHNHSSYDFLTEDPMETVPNSLSAVTKSIAKGVQASASAPSAAPTKTQIPRAYVNPNTVRTGLLGWDDNVTPAAILAAITGEHLLVVGPPGNAKSLFARRFFANFEGKLFETQLSKYSDETALFGAPNLKKLREEGEFEYPKHGLAAAEWAFLDEFFDASDVLMRTTLGILQEKKFTKGGHEEDIPLNSVIATANYTRVNDITAAVVDRFAMTVASPILTPAQREMLYGHQTFEDIPRISNIIGLDQLKSMRAKAKEVEIPASIIKALISWTSEMGFTPRRERKLASIIRASASLNNRRRADENDILAARFCVPISNSGKVEDATKSLQPLKDAIVQALHEGEQLAAVGKFNTVVTQRSDSPQDVIAAMKATKAKMNEIRSFNCVSEKVNKAREAALTLHDNHYQELNKLLDL